MIQTLRERKFAIRAKYFAALLEFENRDPRPEENEELTIDIGVSLASIRECIRSILRCGDAGLNEVHGTFMPPLRVIGIDGKLTEHYLGFKDRFIREAQSLPDPKKAREYKVPKNTPRSYFRQIEDLIDRYKLAESLRISIFSTLDVVKEAMRKEEDATYRRAVLKLVPDYDFSKGSILGSLSQDTGFTLSMLNPKFNHLRKALNLSDEDGVDAVFGALEKFIVCDSVGLPLTATYNEVKQAKAKHLREKLGLKAGASPKQVRLKNDERIRKNLAKEAGLPEETGWMELVNIYLPRWFG